MDEGLIQLLVVAAIIIFSMMDGAARKRRKEAQSLGHSPTSDGFPEAADDVDQVDESSGAPEGLVPEDLWKEIAALARGEMPASRQEQPATPGPSSTGDPISELEAWTVPEQDVSTETPPADLQSGYFHPDQALTHREHAQVASPARPLPEELPEELPEALPHEFVPHSPAQPSEPQKEVRGARKPRSLLSGVRLGAKSSIREAIVLAEVLSPPVTLRDSGWKPLF